MCSRHIRFFLKKTGIKAKPDRFRLPQFVKLTFLMRSIDVTFRRLFCALNTSMTFVHLNGNGTSDAICRQHT